jgi:hypothetical protein
MPLVDRSRIICIVEAVPRFSVDDSKRAACYTPVERSGIRQRHTPPSITKQKKTSNMLSLSLLNMHMEMNDVDDRWINLGDCQVIAIMYQSKSWRSIKTVFPSSHR